MKMKHCVSVFLVLVLCAGVQLHAQQTGAERKLFESIKTKAEKGDPLAQCGLGEIYSFGEIGVATNSKEALKWFRRAALQDVAEAQYNLAACCDHGLGMKTDKNEAMVWYRKAAEQGVPEAETILGYCYANGEDLPRSPTEAVKWYRKAADHRYAEAEFNLGCCYRDGVGVSQDAIEAVKWFRKAAEQGFVQAQCVLGAKYLLGEGVIRDYVQAYKWLNLASAQGFENAKSILSAVESQMTQVQIAEAQQLAREFKPHESSRSDSSVSDRRNIVSNWKASGTGFFITDDGYLVSNFHVVRDAIQVRLITSVGFIPAAVVKVDAANDLALLKAVGAFKPLPIAASRTVKLGGTVAMVGFPDIGLQRFAPKVLAHGHHGGNRVAGGRGG